MTDPNSPNHWDALASLLGANPPPEGKPSSEAASIPPVALPPAASKRAARRSQPSPPRAANWDALASELGIAPSAAPEPSPVADAKEAALPTRDIVRDASDAAESPNFFDESFDFEEPFDILDATESASQAAPDSESFEPTEKRRRKRRRRRKPGKEKEAGRQAPLSSAESAAAEGVTTVSGEFFERLDADEADEPVSQKRETGGREAGDLDERRTRGRRPRRGKKRRERPAEESTAASAPDEADLQGGSDIKPPEAGEEVDRSDEQSGKMVFRGIPTWEETVGLVISKNLESRSKRPGNGPYQGRGNRGGRDNRGGRGDHRRRS